MPKLGAHPKGGEQRQTLTFYDGNATSARWSCHVCSWIVHTCSGWNVSGNEGPVRQVKSSHMREGRNPFVYLTAYLGQLIGVRLISGACRIRSYRMALYMVIASMGSSSFPIPHVAYPERRRSRCDMLIRLCISPLEPGSCRPGKGLDIHPNPEDNLARRMKHVIRSNDDGESESAPTFRGCPRVPGLKWFR